MARPKRENADYFSHDAGMRDDPKVKALRNKFGITGYAVWCMMLEILTNSDFFKIKIEELEIEILSADFGIEADLFEEILSYMLRLKLLQSVDNCEYLSQKLTDRLQPVVDKRRNSRPKGVSVTESTQSKVKETKVKEKKLNKTKEEYALPVWVDKKTWADFEEMRKVKKKPMTDRARTTIINKLKGFGEAKADQILEQSITHCWDTVYDLKQDNNTPTTDQPEIFVI